MALASKSKHKTASSVKHTLVHSNVKYYSCKIFADALRVATLLILKISVINMTSTFNTIADFLNPVLYPKKYQILFNLAILSGTKLS